jgi:hypothetical protein
MPHTSAVTLIRSVLATAGEGAAYQGLELALGATRTAGVRAVQDNPRLTPAERLAVALQAAGEELEGIRLTLAEGEGAAGG